MWNDRPVVGIVAEDYYGPVAEKSTYIAASYVKWIEATGCRVLPILLNQTDGYYDRVLGIVSGVIFPGGSVHIHKETLYGRSGFRIYKKILHKNKTTHLPLWGTCLGMELAIYAHLDGVEPRTRCSMRDKALCLKFGDNPGRLFNAVPEGIFKSLTTQAVNYHHHRWCLTSETFIRLKLDEDYRALAFTDDAEGEQFVSILEHKSMPIYLVQFHPEKAQFEWVNDLKHQSIPHTESAVAVGQFFANFFASECRRSQAKFPPYNEQELIYSYPVTYTGSNSAYMQCYLFA